MEIARALRLTVLIVGLLAAFNVAAQETGAEQSPPIPVPDALTADMWVYFEGSRGEVEPKVSAFLEAASSRISELGPQNQETAQSILTAVSDNFAALLSLMDDAEPASQELPPEAVSYSIEQLLEFELFKIVIMLSHIEKHRINKFSINFFWKS